MRFNRPRPQFNQYNPEDDIQTMPQYALPEVQMPQQYDPGYAQKYEFIDTIDQYGSIIKELTDTKELLEIFELRLLGKKKLTDGTIVQDSNQRAYIKDPQVARDFVDLVRSVVNRHTDFSYLSESEAHAYIKGAIETFERWCMLQGDRIPLHFRSKLTFEAEAYVAASIHKATNGRMLIYTKGTFNVNESSVDQKKEDKGIMGTIFPFLGNRRK